MSRLEIRRRQRLNPFELSKKFKKGQRCIIYSKTMYNVCYIDSIRWERNVPKFKVRYKGSPLKDEYGLEYLLTYMPKWRYWLMVYRDNLTDGTWSKRTFIDWVKSLIPTKEIK